MERNAGESSLRGELWPCFYYYYQATRINTLFCSYKEKVKDYNFGSLIRTDAKDEYGEANTIFGT